MFVDVLFSLRPQTQVSNIGDGDGIITAFSYLPILLTSVRGLCGKRFQSMPVVSDQLIAEVPF